MTEFKLGIINSRINNHAIKRIDCKKFTNTKKNKKMYITRKEQVKNSELRVIPKGHGHWTIYGLVYNRYFQCTITDSTLVDEYYDINENSQNKANSAAWLILKRLRAAYKLHIKIRKKLINK
jgi:hypothetical protein